MTPDVLATGISSAWAAFVARDARRPTPHRTVYASAWRPCERRMVLDMTQPDQAPRFPPEVLAKFRRGNDRERDILADLSRVGRDAEPAFTVIGQQERFELKDHKSRVAISGKVDARIVVDGLSVPVEVKAWAPMMVDRLRTFADLFDNPWTRAGAHQLLAYLYGAGVPFGFLVLDRSGLPLLLPVELEPHLERLEDFLMRAERAIDHVEAGTLPPFLLNDAAECRRCPYYGGACNPPTTAVGAQVLTDPEFEALLERRLALEDAASEYDRIDKDVKARLRGVESAVAGRFVIEGAWGKSSRVELPPDLKAVYTKTDPKGRFTITITRVSA